MAICFVYPAIVFHYIFSPTGKAGSRPLESSSNTQGTLPTETRKPSPNLRRCWSGGKDGPLFAMVYCLLERTPGYDTIQYYLQSPSSFVVLSTRIPHSFSHWTLSPLFEVVSIFAVQPHSPFTNNSASSAPNLVSNPLNRNQLRCRVKQQPTSCTGTKVLCDRHTVIHTRQMQSHPAPLS